MKLPKIDLPLYELVLPSTGEKVKYRAFTVKEEKIMLIAKESRDSEQIILSIKQIIDNCLIDKKSDDLSIFDVEYVILMIRGKSVNNTIDFSITDPETGEDIKLSVDIEDVKIIRNEEHTNRIKLNDQYTMFMKYPSYDLFAAATKNIKDANSLLFYDVMISCIDKVVSADEVYQFSDFTREDVDKFMEDLESDVIERIQKFFETMPKLRHEIHYVNSVGNKKAFVIEGTESFFM